jgi:hypothetical protein
MMKLLDLKMKTAHFYDVVIQAIRKMSEKLKKDLEELKRRLP